MRRSCQFKSLGAGYRYSGIGIGLVIVGDEVGIERLGVVRAGGLGEGLTVSSTVDDPSIRRLVATMVSRL